MAGIQIREIKKPSIKGPFRGLIINFERNTNFEEFKEVFAEITFQHPNHYFSEIDKRKAIIYYKNPYDVATTIDKYQNNGNFQISIFYDRFSRTLRPDVLYITAELKTNLTAQINQLHGEIINKTRVGVQVQFDTFKAAAIAMEELRRKFSVKFAYKTDVIFDRQARANGNEVEDSIQELLNKYKEWTPELKNDFKKALSKINKEDQAGDTQRIKRASENLDLANISKEEAPSDNGSQKSEAWDTMATPSNVMLELHQMYRKMQEAENKKLN